MPIRFSVLTHTSIGSGFELSSNKIRPGVWQLMCIALVMVEMYCFMGRAGPMVERTEMLRFKNDILGHVLTARCDEWIEGFWSR